MRWLVAALLLQAALGSAPSPAPAPPAPPGPPGPVLPGLVDSPRRCSYHHAYRMLGAYCSTLNLLSVPSTLKTNIQILDISFNRIRELHSTTFQRYPSIRYLYLADNMIQDIDPRAFEPLTSLETLDLSFNSLTTIQPFIMNLPSLRKLYISRNILSNLNHDLKVMVKPVEAPLSFLNLANCRLEEFPDFGVMPELEHLNISSNRLKNLSPKELAPFCSLKTLDLTDTTYNLHNICQNKQLSMWFKERGINISPDINSVFMLDSEESKICPDMPYSEEDLRVYDECKSLIKIKKQERVARKTWTIIGGCLGAFLILFIGLLFWMHRRNVRRTKSLKKVKNITKKDEAENNSSNLLSDVS